MLEKPLGPESDQPSPFHGTPPAAEPYAEIVMGQVREDGRPADRTRPVERKPVERKPVERTVGGNQGGSFLRWTMSLLLMLLAFQFLAPYLAEQIQYSLTRGKQRAEYEAAVKGLKTVSLDKLSLASQMISQRVGPSVVHINTSDLRGSDEQPGAWLPHGRQTPRGQGSGIIVDREGYIVTNQHVVAGVQDIQVRLSDGRLVDGTLIGQDALTDIALLKIEADNLTPAQWGDSDDLDVGALVWAVGSPFGLHRSITFGILSAKNRAGMAGKPHQEFLQTDAAVNPGNSGGPLINARGEVVGVNTAIVGEVYQGISFSIPSNVARDVYEQLRENHHVTRGWLGVLLEPVTPEQAERNGMRQPSGALVAQVVNDVEATSPAYDAGVRPGDIVVQWNEAVIHSPATLTQEVARTPVGSSAKVILLRDGERVELSVAVTARPDRYSN